MTTTYIANRLPSQTDVNRGKSPYEVLYGKVPNYTFMKCFGCLAFAYNPEKRKDKFQARGVPCIFIGYSHTQKGYKMHNLLTGVSFVSRDVRFYESVYPYHIFHSVSSQPNVEFGKAQAWNDSDEGEPVLTKREEVEEQVVEQVEEEQHTQVVQRRSTRDHKAPTWHSDYQVSANCVQKVGMTAVSSQYTCLLSNVSKALDPRHFKQAMKHSHWLQANEELEALEGNNTW